MNEHSGKRFPLPSPETKHYWQGCHEHELRIQRCKDCGNHQFYPRIICTSCMSSHVEWIESSGKGEVLSYTIITRAVSEAYVQDVPYIVALIKLQEGPCMMSNVVKCEVEEVKIGMPVSVVFEDWSEEISIPKFQPLN
ncbi:MAG: putative OB-fold protein [Gammaproteobacteria bacterium]|jgi:uncharacterized OB-fold protein